MSFGQIFRQLRIKKGLSQRAVANALGYSVSAISMYEHDRRQPDFQATERIADFFEVSIDYLYGRVDEYNGYVQAVSEHAPQPRALIYDDPSFRVYANDRELLEGTAPDLGQVLQRLTVQAPKASGENETSEF